MKLGYFLWSCLLAFIGGHMLNYTVIFLALEWFSSPFLSGLGFALAFGPPIILGWLAGVYCDRYAPRRVILIAQNAYLLAAVILGTALYLQPHNLLPFYLIASFCLGVAWSFVAPARFAAVRFYVEQNKLVAATISLNVMVMLGFGLAPILVKALSYYLGWWGVLTVSSTFIFISSAILLRLPHPFIPESKQSTLTMLNQVKAVIAGSMQLQTYLLLAAAVYFLMGPIQILLPNIAQHLLNLSQLQQGLYLSLVALALITGGLVALWIKHWKNRIDYLVVIITLSTAGLISLSIISQPLISSIVLFISASLGGISVSLIVSGLQSQSNDNVRGRVMASYTILSQVLPAFSGLLAGFVAETQSTSFGFIATSLLVVILLFFISLRCIRSNQLEKIR